MTKPTRRHALLLASALAPAIGVAQPEASKSPGDELEAARQNLARNLEELAKTQPPGAEPAFIFRTR